MITVKDNVYSKHPKKFLRPQQIEFPVDGPAKKLFEELERCGWEVPGISVEFDTYGSGNEQFITLKEVKGVIKGEPFLLRFGKGQGTMPSGNGNDTAGLHDISVGKKRITLCEDRSPIVMESYVGSEEEWVKDRDSFQRYGGPINEVFSEMSGFITEKVLPYVQRFPTFRREIEEIVPNTPIPLEKPMELYAVIDRWDARKLEDKEEGYEDSREIGIQGGWRLLHLGTRDDKTFSPVVAYEGFTYCVSSPEMLNSEAYERTNKSYRSSDDQVIKVKVEIANDTYVVDLDEGEQIIRDYAEKQPEEGYPDSILNEEKKAIARTMVPLSEYRGGFVKPCFLIRRELSLDEVSRYQMQEESKDRMIRV